MAKRKWDSIKRNIEQEARRLLRKYGLSRRGWKFEWSERGLRKGDRRRPGPGGTCEYGRKTVRLHVILVLGVCLNAAARRTVMLVLLHEIAHALAGFKAGHGSKWRAKCLEIGGAPGREIKELKNDIEGVARPRKRVHKRKYKRDGLGRFTKR